MKRVDARRGIRAAALALLMPLAAFAGPYQDLLTEADRVRAIDPVRFDQVMTALERRSAEATETERRHLRLLGNYRSVLRGEYERAIGDSIVLFDEAPEPEIRYRAGLLVANIAALTRDFTVGLRYLERSLPLQAQVQDPEVRLFGHSVAATVYNEYGQYALGKAQAEQLLAGGARGRLRCAGTHMLLEARHHLNEPLNDGPFMAAIEECTAEGDAIAKNLIRATLAQRWSAAGKKEQALALLEASLPEVERTGFVRLLGEFHSLLAQIKLDLGRTAQAQAHAERVVLMEGQDPLWLPNVVAHHVLYRIALARGDVASALRAYRTYAEADKARLDDIKAREYAFQLSRHELNQKNQSIELLRNQNQVLRLQQEVAQRSAWNFRLAIALLLVITASAAYWGWRARRMHRNLHQLANTDGLTGLSNRRHFRARSESVLAQCEQRGRPVSVLLFDLDHFKQINDQCGHSSGDWVLREVAKVGRRHCREGDLYGRIGGEEFAMTLVDCDMEAALRIAEQCRRSIDAIDAQQGAGCPLGVAASIGVVSTSISGYHYETLIAHADAAMYRSKVAGRNRVSLYQPPPVPENGQPVVLDGRNAAAMLREY